MKKFQYDDFVPKDVWLIFRLDTQVADQAADVYMLMELPQGIILSHVITLGEGLKKREEREFFGTAFTKAKYWPKRFLILKGDPIEKSLKQFAGVLKPFTIEQHPASAFEDLIAPVKESFGQRVYSPSSAAYQTQLGGPLDPDEFESAKQFIPDAYDPCPCASGKKYKFCCKPIFREIMMAMTEAEEGKKKSALKYIQEAKKRVGETGEVLCREAIVYGFFDDPEYEPMIDRCLQLFPCHPRANYIKGLICREKELLPEALVYYQKAIENYPKTDRFHLNETYNNLGSVYFDLKNHEQAKESWEKALFLLPSDTMVKRNLVDFIYNNPAVPAELQSISPLVARLLEGKKP